MTNDPNWKKCFPVKQRDEHRVNRRQFAAFCGCSVVALGVAAAGKGRLLALPKATDPMVVAKEGEIPSGGYKLFNYPTENNPCIVVRLVGENRYAAYSQSCTHLACPVYFEPSEDQLVCPCHEGYFDARDGTVLAGPPQRSLPQYSVRVVDGEVIVGPEVSGESDI